MAKFGFDGIELRGELQLYDVDEIKRLSDKYKMKVLSICEIYPDPEKKGQLAERYRKRVRK